MRIRACFIYASLILLFPLSGSLRADSPGAPQAPPAGAAGVVTVDFKAVGESGAPILDLTAADISLKVGGKARVVKSLELVREGSPRTASDGTVLPPLPPPFATNRPADRGRNVFFIVEDESVPSGREQSVKDAVGAVLDNLSGREALSLVVISRGKFDVSAATQQESVRSVVANLVGRANQAETVEDATCRTQQAVTALRGIVDNLGGATPTTIVFISGGLTPPAAGTAIKGKATTGSSTCEVRQEMFTDLSAAAQKASVDLYTVQIPTDMRGGTAAGSDTVAGVENLAGVTGNALIRLSGNLKTEMERVTRETASYYLVSFEPDQAERTGSARRVELRVSRENAKVRARSEVTIPKDGGAPAAAKTMTARDMLRVATPFSDLPIRAVVSPGRDAADKDLKLVVMFEPFEVNVAFASATVGLFDEKGKLAAQWTAQPADLGALPVMSGFTVKAGTYRMRVAATDASGRGGTVDQNVTVALEKGEGPVQMSALILGSPLGNAFGPRMLYQAESMALGYFEVYGTPKTGAVTAAIEIAASASGPALATAPAGVGVPGTDGRRVVLGKIPIDKLRPGDYLVSVVVNVEGKPVGRVSRTLRKVGK
jgi:hypothetical protein